MIVHVPRYLGENDPGRDAYSGGIAQDWVATSAENAPATVKVGFHVDQEYPLIPSLVRDLPVELVIGLTPETQAVKDVIAGLFVRSGADWPRSQLAALYQAATGAGEDLTVAGFADASIAPDQQLSFRSEAAKVLVLWTGAPFHQPGDEPGPSYPDSISYPGPSFQATVDALRAVGPCQVVGIVSGSDGEVMHDMTELASATGTVAPVGGVDCDNDGVVDLTAGEPLLCLAPPASAGIGRVIVASVEAALESPIAEAGVLQVVEATSTVGTPVVLDGSASVDPQHGALTYTWTGDFGSVTGVTPTATLPLGYNAITLTVTDPDGNTGKDRVLVIVRRGTVP